MSPFLVYRLSASLGSMGDNAGNERRGSERWPARSAVTGAIAGAIGIDRVDRDRLAALENGYRVGVAARRVGDLLVDYHTAQFVPGSAVRRPDSRPHALSVAREKRKVGTILSQREYHEECLFDVVIAAAAVDAPWTLEELRDSLRCPRFIPYFGRKACPLDLPMHPLVVRAADALDAFDAYDRERPSLAEAPKPRSKSFTARLDPPLFDETGRSEGRRIRRRDGVVDRQRWLFADRETVEIHVEREPSA